MPDSMSGNNNNITGWQVSYENMHRFSGHTPSDSAPPRIPSHVSMINLSDTIFHDQLFINFPPSKCIHCAAVAPPLPHHGTRCQEDALQPSLRCDRSQTSLPSSGTMVHTSGTTLPASQAAVPLDMTLQQPSMRSGVNDDSLSAV
ncbi:hypothetical protein BaRGS_00013108 [Batillaria attramentaria]|uniref:Uncharacterized protein n=1 Tax=Batillaria attramentaria TaxID=370345 RepID=A0ABD0L8N7_9CAEN